MNSAPLLPPAAPRRKRWLIPVGLGVAAVAGAVGLLVVRRDDDGLDTTAADAELRSLADTVQIPDGETSVTLSGPCPFGNLDTISAAAPTGVNVDGDFGDDIVAAFVSDDSSDPLLFQCVRSAVEGDTVFGVIVGNAPQGSFSEYIDRSVKSIGTTTSKTERPHLGGTIVQYCIDLTEGGQSSCESDWTNGKIQIGLFTTESTPEETTEWLEAVLPTMIGELNELRADDVDLTPQS